jgi:hypothetical protein
MEKEAEVEDHKVDLDLGIRDSRRSNHIGSTILLEPSVKTATMQGLDLMHCRWTCPSTNGGGKSILYPREQVQ